MFGIFYPHVVLVAIYHCLPHCEMMWKNANSFPSDMHATYKDEDEDECARLMLRQTPNVKKKKKKLSIIHTKPMSS
jgi:hypothetical protein